MVSINQKIMKKLKEYLKKNKTTILFLIIWTSIILGDYFFGSSPLKIYARVCVWSPITIIWFLRNEISMILFPYLRKHHQR